MIICPKCGCLIEFNSYFGEYSCNNCKWKDDTYKRQRVEQYRKFTSQNTEDSLHGKRDKEIVCV
jgi:uncharacterized Zn finger protein (UPF0148 family)